MLRKYTRTNIDECSFDILSNRYECQTKLKRSNEEIFTFWSRAIQWFGSTESIPACLYFCFKNGREKNSICLSCIKPIITGNSTSNNGKTLPIIEMIWLYMALMQPRYANYLIVMWIQRKNNINSKQNIGSRHSNWHRLNFRCGSDLVCVVCAGLGSIIDWLWCCQCVNGLQPH